MSGINLNSEEFNNERVIFNNGVAGVVQDVSVRIDKKKADANPQAPPFQVTFIDPNGGEVSQSIFYLGDPTGDKEVDDRRRVNAGALLKHIWGAIMGEAPIPEFPSMNAAVDGVMEAISAHLTANPDLKFNTVVNYGNENRPRKYITVKRFPPFMEKAGIAANESRLYLAPSDRTKPFVEDSPDAEYKDVHQENSTTQWPTS